MKLLLAIRLKLNQSLVALNKMQNFTLYCLTFPNYWNGRVKKGM